MVRCPFCPAEARPVRGRVQRYGVAVEAWHHVCDACGGSFLTFEQEGEAERLALAALDGGEARAEATVRRAPARVRAR
jgi:transcriptional regulator NrdR family protein